MAKSLTELLHHLVTKGEWFTEEERDDAHSAAGEFERFTEWIVGELKRLEELIYEIIDGHHWPPPAGSRITIVFGPAEPKS